MLEGHSVLPRRRGKVVAARVGCKSKRLGSKGSVGVPTKNFQCEVCEIFVNSETQLSQVGAEKDTRAQVRGQMSTLGSATGRCAVKSWYLRRDVAVFYAPLSARSLLKKGF